MQDSSNVEDVHDLDDTVPALHVHERDREVPSTPGAALHCEVLVALVLVLIGGTPTSRKWPRIVEGSVHGAHMFVEESDCGKPG